MQSKINSQIAPERYYLQIIHGSFDGPFIEVARATCSLINSIDKNNRVITVFLYGSFDDEIASYVGGDEIIFLDVSPLDLKGSKNKLIKNLLSKISHHNYEMCVAHRSKPTRIALKALKCPVISVHHDYGDYRHFLKRIFLSLYTNRVTLVGVSNAITQDLQKTFKLWPINKFQTLYNRINVDSIKSELLSRSDARKHLGVESDDWVIGNVGRLHPVKDQATLLRAFAQARKELPINTKLILIGVGRQESNLKLLAENLEIKSQIIFSGYQKHAKKLFKAFDCFALTSLREPFGMVLLEAMAADIPLIISDCGGGTEVVGDCARIFPVGDVDSLSKAIIQQYEIGAIATSKQIENRLRDKFSDEASIEQFKKILSIAES